MSWAVTNVLDKSFKPQLHAVVYGHNVAMHLFSPIKEADIIKVNFTDIPRLILQLASSISLYSNVLGCDKCIGLFR